MLTKILVAVLTALQSFISLIDESKTPKHVLDRFRRISIACITAVLSLTVSGIVLAYERQDRREGNIAYETLFSGAAAQYEVSRFILASKLHQEDPSRFPPAKLNLSEINLQISHISNDITRASDFLSSSTYDNLRLFEHQLVRLASHGTEMGSDTAIDQLKMVSSTVDNICNSINTEKFGLDDFCTYTNEYFREGGYWPRLQKIQEIEKQQSQELPLQYRI